MRRILAAGGFLAVIALAAAAPALANSDTVAISVHGTSFTGTVENTGTKAHNFIAIGTAAQEGNPIETFLIEGGRDCHKYAGAGSIYCMAMIKPGQTVSFRGTTMMPTTPWSSEVLNWNEVVGIIVVPRKLTVWPGLIIAMQ